jgi:hypothetical protein
VRVDKGLERIGGAAIGQGATGGEVGHHHLAGGVQDLCGLRHEVDAAKHNDVVLRALRDPRQGKRIADVVGEVLDFGFLVVVGQDNRVALFFEAPDLLLELFGEKRLARERNKRVRHRGSQTQARRKDKHDPTQYKRSTQA